MLNHRGQAELVSERLKAGQLSLLLSSFNSSPTEDSYAGVNEAWGGNFAG